jgi:hypothetical protein
VDDVVVDVVGVKEGVVIFVDEVEMDGLGGVV